ncbi:hypothetical protein HanIR_Chr14g0695961 [Helianthus annuus]|nr:hypothetical protein HanIR_Chr14g0695961 [Helianthus annuus]
METNDGRRQWTHEAIKCMLEEVPRHGSSADREFMSQLRDQIAQELMQNNVL